MRSGLLHDSAPVGLVEECHLLGCKGSEQEVETRLLLPLLAHRILYSLIDQTLSCEQQPSTPMDTVSVVADLRRQHFCWNHVEGTHWHTRFSHLINYGAA
ncbi:putative mitochondrial intermediate peptidase, mitochondrial [Cinnamomum micranthum f. kanehirae]|uniref:Putative mitochondrial intermediate peptidase, mitochondrial n=1 Tax=Cinnamomum micranthum f. kanehirae TaxID=337451 RepID=A0A3S3MWF4_9MAGN|nr:putative mitochondrial intermediate peptidase, mitochondrial [Cinnamomum micranthum f. kanehirae]